MKRITTESGSVYLYDELRRRFRRESLVPVVDGKHADGVWHDAYPVNGLIVGAGIVWLYDDPETTGSILAAGAEARIRYTTPVVSIVEEPWPND